MKYPPIFSMLRLGIIALHVVFLFILLFSPSFVFDKKPHKPLVIKTIVPKTAAVAKTSAPAPTPANKTTPAPKPQKAAPKKEQPIPKPAAQKPTPKKEPAIADKQLSKAKQPAPPAKKNPPPQNRAKISDSLRKELEESIAKMEHAAPTKKKTPPRAKAAMPIPLQIDADVTENESYTSLLISHLHQVLSLPDYGEVKIQLILRQDGTVAKITVLKAQSEKNKQYLETHLPQIKFPKLDGKECTFVLTFCNE